MHVLDQQLHQANVVKNDKHWGDRWKPEKTPVQKLVDDGMKWIHAPENQKMVLELAFADAEDVLPDEGAGGTVRKALGAIAPFVRRKGDR